MVHVANFYAPSPVDCAPPSTNWERDTSAGHDAALVVPGRERSDRMLPRGVRRITVPAARLPLTGGYRAAHMRPATDVLTGLAPDVIEVSDRLTHAGWGVGGQARYRLGDDLARTARPAARSRSCLHSPSRARRYRQPSHRAQLRHGGLCDRLRSRRIRPSRPRRGRRQRTAGAVGSRSRGVSPGPIQRGHSLRAGRAPSQLLAVHCGRLSVEKHVERSIDALAILRVRGYDVRLVVAGDGPRRTHLRRRTAELAVDFLGHLTDRQEAATLLASADIALVVVSQSSAFGRDRHLPVRRRCARTRRTLRLATRGRRDGRRLDQIRRTTDVIRPRYRRR